MVVKNRAILMVKQGLVQAEIKKNQNLRECLFDRKVPITLKNTGE